MKSSLYNKSRPQARCALCAMHYALAPLLYTLYTLLLTSCDFHDTPETIPAYNMRLSEYEFTLLVGDTVDLECRFEPEAVTAPKAFWDKNVPNVQLTNQNGYVCRVIGAQPGDAWVYATTLNDNKRDSCLVHVIEPWLEFVPEQFQYDMIVVADIDIDGVHNDPATFVGAFIGSQLRGVSEVRSVGSHTISTFRIYSNRPNDGDVRFRYREPLTHKIIQLDVTIPFDGELHGTPTSPIVMTNK